MPEVGNELKDVKVSFISLVKKGANKQQFEIFKSADYVPEETQSAATVEKSETGAVDEEAKQAKGLLNVLKTFFNPEAPKQSEVAKASYTTFNERITNFRGNIWRALDILGYTISDILWSEYDSDHPESGEPLAAIEQACNEFVAYCRELGGKVGVTKMAEDEKFTPSITKENISIFKGMVENLNRSATIIQKGAEEEMSITAEQLQEMLSPISKSIETLTDKVSQLEKGAEEVKTEVGQKTEEVAKSEAEKVADVAKQNDEKIVGILADLKKSVDGLTSKVETLENARGIAKSEEGSKDPVEKSEEDPWAGLLF